MIVVEPVYIVDLPVIASYYDHHNLTVPVISLNGHVLYFFHLY